MSAQHAPHGPVPPAAVAMGLATAYQASQAVVVAATLGISDFLAKGAMSSSEIALKTATHPDRMHRLLRVLAAFGVVNDIGSERFELTPVGDCLRADAPNSVRPLVLMYGGGPFWQTVVSLADCVRTGRNGFELLYGLDGCFAYLEKHPDPARIFDDAMSGRSSITGPAAAEAYDFTGVGHIIDVAGGHGQMLAWILKAHPHLRGTLFDLPRVVENAASLLAREGISDRCDIVGGDMFAAVPAGGDLYLLSRVIHDWDDARAITLLQACRRAMAPTSKLLILDRVMPDQIAAGPSAQSNVLLDLSMMLWTTGGRERTSAEFEALLSAAELRLHRIIPMPIPDSLVEATPAQE